ncbi:MAG: PorT family protein [Bacteroidota bacterium]|nr:PorT family protein [Bacteroidota bacterium]
MKKFISTLVVSFIVFSFSPLYGQKTLLGLKGGISIPNLTSGGSDQNPLNTGYSSRLGGDAALFVQFNLSKVCSLQPMVEYSAQGGKKNGMQAFPTPTAFEAYFPPGNAPTYLYANYKSVAKLDYLLVPVLVKFGWDLGKQSPYRFYFDAGPFVGFLLEGKQVTSGSSNIYADPAGQQPLTSSPQSFDNTDNIKSQLHSTNFGAEANIGFSYHTGNILLFLEGGGNYGFLNIQKGTANGRNNTGAGTLTAGIEFSLGK